MVKFPSSGSSSISSYIQFNNNTSSSTPVTIGLLTIAISILLYLLFVPPRRLYSGSHNNVRVIKNRFPGLGAVGFFANRYQYLNRVATKDQKHPHHGIAKFNLLNKIVYTFGGTDEDEIRTFANNRDLSFSQGNTFLFAGIAGARQKGINEEGEMDAEEKKEMRELAKAISPQRLNNLAPRLASDAYEAIESLLSAADGEKGAASSVDLQQTYYPLVFRFTVRVMGMAEYASRPAELRKLFDAFWLTQKNSGFWTTILPWIPQPRLLKRVYGAIILWSMVRKTLKERVETGHREDDYAQDLIDRKVSHNNISRFVVGGLIAGILNTIGTGAYSVAFVGADEKLQADCKAALVSGLKRSCEERGDDYDELTPLQRLQRVTLEEWESYEEFTILHLVFKEAIRLLLTNSLNRYYPGPSYNKDGTRKERLRLYGEEIEDDSYICYSPPSNLHDADRFPEPFKFDPYRYKPGHGDTEYNYVAWGVGIHRCTGIRFAKLETIIALAAFLLFTDMKTVNDKGEAYSLQQVPLPDLSQGHWRSPMKPMKVEIRRPQ